METVRISPRWTLHRLGCAANVSCVVALLLDDDEGRHYEIRVALNGDVFYQRRYRQQDEAERDAADALSDLIAAGWQMDLSVEAASV